MADKKDKTPSEDKKKSEVSTNSSKEKQFLDKEPEAVAADIDTSHLTLDESPDNSGSSLESEHEIDTPDINTSHLSLEDEQAKKPASTSSGTPSETEPETGTSKKKAEPSNNLLFVKNPLAKKSPEQNANTPKKPPPQPPIEQGPSGRVVLSSDIPDAEFIDNVVKKDVPASTDEPASDKNDEPENPIKSILGTFQKPEKIVQNAWSNSSARRFLIDNVESFRTKDEDQNMESVIENVYGGAVEKKIAPAKFLKENLLFSFLLFLFLFLVAWKSAEIFFPEFMPALNDQIIDTVKNTTGGKKKAEIEEEKKPVVTNFENKEKIEQVLSHCLVKPNARVAFAQAFSPVGYEFTDRSLTGSYDEVEASIAVWKKMNMEYYINDAVYRFDVLSKLALPVTAKANSVVAQYKKSLLDLSSEAEKLKKTIRDIKTRGGNQSTYTINERIPLLNKLEKINTRLSVEPDISRFDQILKKIESVENILTGKLKPVRIGSEELVEKNIAWLVKTASIESDGINLPISKKVLPAIKTSTAKLKRVTPKLTAFQLTELESALNDLSKLSALLVYFPENMLAPYKLELSGLNRRLNTTMSKELRTWVSFDRCLAKTRSKNSALLE